MQETWGLSLGEEEPQDKGMATHSSIPAWEIPWVEEPGRLQSTGSQRVRHNWVHKHAPHTGCPNSLTKGAWSTVEEQKWWKGMSGGKERRANCGVHKWWLTHLGAGTSKRWVSASPQQQGERPGLCLYHRCLSGWDNRHGSTLRRPTGSGWWECIWASWEDSLQALNWRKRL